MESRYLPLRHLPFVRNPLFSLQTKSSQNALQWSQPYRVQELPTPKKEKEKDLLQRCFERIWVTVCVH